MTTATANISHSAEQPATTNQSARQLWQELRLAESEAYWRRKAIGKWPTEQNGKLHHDGAAKPSQPVDQFLQDLARTFCVCSQCNGAYPCGCRARRNGQKPSANGPPADGADEPALAVECVSV